MMSFKWVETTNAGVEYIRSMSGEPRICFFFRFGSNLNDGDINGEPRKKKTSYFPFYWLFNRDPYKGFL